MKTIIQIPCFNEEATLPLVLQDLPPGVEIVVIDDGSTDRTRDIARKSGATVLKHNKNQGLGRAFKTGLEYAVKKQADILVNTDGDNQYPGKYIPGLIEPLIKNQADLVIGNRRPWTIKEFGFLKRIFQYLGSLLIRMLIGANIPDPVSGFRAYNKKAMRSLNLTSKFSYTLESLAQALKNKCRVISIPIITNPSTRPSRLARNLWYFIFHSGWIIASKFSLYTLGGAIAYGMRVGITSFLTEILGLYYFNSYLITLACVLIFGFYYSSRITFKVSGSFNKYLAVWAGFYLLDALLVKFLTEMINFHYVISISLVAIFVFITKFFVFDKIVFKNGR